MYNPTVRGWIACYGHVYRTQQRPTHRRIDAYVIRWARRKYRRMVHWTKGGEGLVRPAPPDDAEALRSLATMSWQRPNIGSRVTREGHARFWERPGVKLPRATRRSRTLSGKQNPTRDPRTRENCWPQAAGPEPDSENLQVIKQMATGWGTRIRT